MASYKRKREADGYIMGGSPSSHFRPRRLTAVIWASPAIYLILACLEIDGIVTANHVKHNVKRRELCTLTILLDGESKHAIRLTLLNTNKVFR